MPSGSKEAEASTVKGAPPPADRCGAPREATRACSATRTVTAAVLFTQGASLKKPTTVKAYSLTAARAPAGRTSSRGSLDVATSGPA
jgi:hypothetical protein